MPQGPAICVTWDLERPVWDRDKDNRLDNYCLTNYIDGMSPSIAEVKLMSQALSSPDVIVIGGGPAGSTVSTILAQHGLKVALYERERFPRFHIGESLIPETYWVFERLKMLDKMRASPFVKKFSVQFVNSEGKLSAPFYFWDNKPHDCS